MVCELYLNFKKENQECVTENIFKGPSQVE